MYESPKNVPEGENGNDIHFNSLMMSMCSHSDISVGNIYWHE